MRWWFVPDDKKFIFVSFEVLRVLMSVGAGSGGCGEERVRRERRESTGGGEEREMLSEERDKGGVTSVERRSLVVSFRKPARVRTRRRRRPEAASEERISI